jgi:hypothetical protein
VHPPGYQAPCWGSAHRGFAPRASHYRLWERARTPVGNALSTRARGGRESGNSDKSSSGRLRRSLRSPGSWFDDHEGGPRVPRRGLLLGSASRHFSAAGLNRYQRPTRGRSMWPVTSSPGVRPGKRLVRRRARRRRAHMSNLACQLGTWARRMSPVFLDLHPAAGWSAGRVANCCTTDMPSLGHYLCRPCRFVPLHDGYNRAYEPIATLDGQDLAQCSMIRYIEGPFESNLGRQSHSADGHSGRHPDLTQSR